MNLNNFVMFAGGNKERSEIPLWMSCSNLFVLSSYSEGNPTVMFESLGCNVPYVGSDVGGSSSIVNSDTGILFEPGNVNDLVKKVEFALSKKWNYKKIKEYSEKFSWKNIARDIYKLYGR